ncbi:MAG: hypothetical protein IPH61_05755 [Bacteroidetes bacterium]|nr:hypothetical protein [Bacteroidota bacterium]
MKSLITLFCGILMFSQLALFSQTNTFPSTGSAGIGTTTPNASSLLDISSTTKGVLISRMTKAERDAIASPATGLLVFQTNSTAGFYYFNGSNWTAISTKGANTSLSNLSASGTAINRDLVPNADNTLDLGSLTKRWNEVYVNSIKFMDGTTQSTAGGVGGAGVSGSGTTGYIPKFTSSTAIGNSTIYDNSGNVGINTTSMVGSANFVVKSLNTTGYGGMYINMDGTSGRKPLYGFAVSGTPKAWMYFDEATNQYRVYNSGDRFVIDNTGNIGIGTTSPSTKLDVETTGTSTVMEVTKPWTGSGTTNFDLVSVSNTYNFGYGTGIFSSGGQIGIKGSSANGAQTGYGVYGQSLGAGGDSYGIYGTASSSAGDAFGVYGTTTGGVNQWAGYFNGKVHLENGDDASLSSKGFLTIGTLTSSNIVIDNNEIIARNNGATSTLYLNNDGGNVNMCYSGGNVHIGASDAAATGYLLAVDGKVICEELKVQLSESWPDYVFDENHQLMNLYDLEKSIQLNKHLPGVPSAKEIETDGLAVGEMQRVMMEKIEELTLYIIQLQKQIDELQAENN